MAILCALNFTGVYVVERNPCRYECHEICRAYCVWCVVHEISLVSPEAQSVFCVVTVCLLYFSCGLTRIEKPRGKLPENAILSKSELGVWHAQRGCFQSLTHETAQVGKGFHHARCSSSIIQNACDEILFLNTWAFQTNARSGRDEHFRN